MSVAYEKDIIAWANEQAGFIRAGRSFVPSAQMAISARQTRCELAKNDQGAAKSDRP